MNPSLLSADMASFRSLARCVNTGFSDVKSTIARTHSSPHVKHRVQNLHTQS